MRNPGNPNGTWTFNTDQFFNPGDPSFNFANLTGADAVHRLAAGVLSGGESSHTFEAYAQDQWKLRPNLTLNLGVRYDLQTRVWNEDFDAVALSRGRCRTSTSPRAAIITTWRPGWVAWDCATTAARSCAAGYGVVYTNAQHNLARRREERVPAVHDHDQESVVSRIRIRGRIR